MTTNNFKIFCRQRRQARVPIVNCPVHSIDLRSKRKGLMGSGCGSVGRAVATDTRGPRFETRHRQNLY